MCLPSWAVWWPSGTGASRGSSDNSRASLSCGISGLHLFLVGFFIGQDGLQQLRAPIDLQPANSKSPWILFLPRGFLLVLLGSCDFSLTHHAVLGYGLF